MAHILYRQGDPDAPSVIKDRNGHIVLDLCRVCGLGEMRLDESCVPVVGRNLSDRRAVHPPAR